MKYNAPYGSADPNAAYVDRNTPGAVKGSVPPAKAIEAPQREILSVILAAGLDPSNTDMTQLLQSIQLMIDAATGEGGDESYVLMTQARGRMLAYPEVLTSDGKIPVTSPSTGTVRVPAGYSFVHRGIFTVTTVETDLVTSANKTYHVRWNPSDGFVLKDLADTGYNTSGNPADEVNAAFDSTFDSMLVAKVVTNASNISTVTPLANKDRLRSTNSIATASGGTSATLNWARSPQCAFRGTNKGMSESVYQLWDDIVSNRYVMTPYNRVRIPPVTGGENAWGSVTVESWA